jgi:hypothetical protein
MPDVSVNRQGRGYFGLLHQASLKDDGGCRQAEVERLLVDHLVADEEL